MTSTGRIRIGSAPDSWGVWFPSDPEQTPAGRFFDEVARAGYDWIEIGPYGYLPTDPRELGEELEQYGLKVSAGTVFEHLHRDGVGVADSWNTVWTQIEDVAKLTAAVGGMQVVVIPEMWRDPATGEVLEDRNLTPEQWKKKTGGMNDLGKAMFEKYGVRAQYHPHADSHVDTEDNVYRFLDGTDSEFVNLCLDTGHISYCGGDNLAIINRAPDRIGYLHLKQVDPEVRAKVEAEDLPFGEAVRLGAMIEPPRGIPDMPPLLDAIEKLDIDVFAIVEQDMYPCDPDHPLPIAQRTRRYLGSCGVPSVKF
jgi:inosose dehydratase